MIPRSGNFMVDAQDDEVEEHEEDCGCKKCWEKRIDRDEAWEDR